MTKTSATVAVAFADAVAAPEAVFSLHAAGFNVVAISRRGSRPLVRRLPTVAICEVIAPEQDADTSIVEIREAIARSRASAFLPLDDVALWACSQIKCDGGTSELCAIASPSIEGIRFSLDKWVQLSVARASGFLIPASHLIEDVTDLKGWTTFPAIAKPRYAVRVYDGKVIRRSPQYLQDSGGIATLKPPVILQPLIRGKGEGVFGLADSGELLVDSAHQRVRMMNPHGSGASACRSHIVLPRTLEASKSLIERLGWSGPFMIELLTDPEGRSWFVELNGRLWGSTALGRRLGLEYPSWTVSLVLDPSFRPPEIAARGEMREVRHLARDLEHFAAVLRGPRTKFHAGDWPGKLETMRAVFAFSRRAGFYNTDTSAPNLFLWEVLDHFVDRLRNRIAR